MTWIIIILVVAPLILGSATQLTIEERVGKDIVDDSIRAYMLGVTEVLAVFAVLCIPAIPLGITMYTLGKVYMIVLAFLLVGLIVLLRRHIKHAPKPFIIKSQWHFDLEMLLFFLAALIVVGLQVYRVVYYQPAQYRDDKTYISLVNDIVATGNMATITSYKYVINMWYSFEAFLSWISGIHPLIICKTTLSFFVEIWYALIIWLLGSTLFHGNKKKQALFLMFCGLIGESFRYFNATYMIQYVWPTWGKNITAMIVVPLYLYYVLDQYDTESNNRNLVVTIPTLIVGAYVSTMGLLVLPIQVFLVRIVLFFKRKTKWTIVVAEMMPMVIGLALYLSYAKGWIHVS